MRALYYAAAASVSSRFELRCDMSDVIDLFHPMIASWFRERFGTPTSVQERSWPLIAAGRNLLLSAPTGTGKTLAAFLCAIDRFVTGEWKGGSVRVLYVSPLKALNNDIHRNLTTPIAELASRFAAAGLPFPEIRVETRSGDTPSSDRRRMISKPPHILITTPESLSLLVSSIRARDILTGIETVILDEIHAVAGTKRGTHLLSGVERLVPLSGEFQRIALSATVRPLERVARFVAGYRWIDDAPTGDRRLVERPIVAIAVDDAKEIRLSVRFLRRGAEAEPDEAVWERIAAELAGKILERSSTLVFVNSRKLSEKLTHLVNSIAGTIAFAHHGSLAKEIRLAVEERLKSGELGAIIATSSLEMGIDIGDLDAVFLVETPFSVSSAVQRLGRSGHSVGLPSTGVLYTSHRRDLLDAAVMAKMVGAGEIEEIVPIEAPLDVLAQLLVAMIGVESRSLDGLYDFVRTIEPYRRLTRQSFDSVVEMLAGRFEETHVRELKPRIHVDRAGGSATAADGALRLVYSNGGTIPDRGYYRLVLAGTNSPIGELDEEFVWERRVGDTFTLGTQPWKIAAIDHQKVTVVPHAGKETTPPFWKGETVGRSFHFASRVARLLELIDTELTSERSLRARNSPPPPGVVNSAPTPTPNGPAAALDELDALEPESRDELVDYLKRQRSITGTSLPHRHHVVVEETTLPGTEFTQVFVHTFWGSRVNYPCSIVLEELVERRGWIVRTQSEHDCIHLAFADVEGSDRSPADSVRESLLELAELRDAQIVEVLRRRLEATGFFGARFRENAGRALLLPRAGFGRRSPLWLSRLRAGRLAEQVAVVGNFPITVETWRTCLTDEFELDVLDRLLEEIAAGRTSISAVRTNTPSPFTEGVVWQSMNRFVYTDDTPPGRSRGASVDDEALRSVLALSERPFLDREVTAEVVRKLERSAVAYAPDPGEELVAWIEERVILSSDEWERLVEAVRRDHLYDGPLPVAAAASRVVTLIAPDGSRSVSTVDSIARLLEAADFPGAPTAALGLDPAVEPLVVAARKRIAAVGLEAADFFSQWLASRGPTAASAVVELFAPFGIDAVSTVEELVDAGIVLRGRFLEEGGDDELFDAVNFERVLRTMRSRSRRAIRPVAVTMLPLFLAAWQGIASRERDLAAALASLEGYPAPASAWEESLLPSRVSSYRGSDIDSLLAVTDVGWFGCGDRTVSFAPTGSLDLYLSGALLKLDEDAAALLDRLFPDRLGRYDFYTLHSRSGLSTGELTEALWRLSWQGAIACEGFDPVRRGAAAGFAVSGAIVSGAGLSSGAGDGASGGVGGAGRAGRTRRPAVRRRSFGEWAASRPSAATWHRLATVTPADAMEEEERNRDRVRVLIDRYGIIFRDLLERELAPLSWGRLFRSMRHLELSGEILGGCFFDGVPGIQFGSREAVELLADGLPTTKVYALAATDPAAVSGLATASLRPGVPERLVSNWLVYEGERLAMISRRGGESVEFPGGERKREYLGLFREMLDRAVNPPQAIRVVEIDGRRAVESDDIAAFLECGFRREYKSLTLWKY